jgi:hypothetical protein
LVAAYMGYKKKEAQAPNVSNVNELFSMFPNGDING